MKKWFQATLFRYFLSYFVVFCLSVGSMFLLFREHLISTLTDQYETQITNELNSAVFHLEEEIHSLYTIHSQVVGNVDVIMAKYTDRPYQDPMIRNELKKYVVGKQLIQAVGYIDRKNDEMYCYSLNDYLTYRDGEVTICNANARLSFRPSEHFSNSNQLIYLSDQEAGRFIYLPVNPSFYNHAVFFVLNNEILEASCKSLLSDMVTSTALIAPDGEVPICTRGDKAAYAALDDERVFFSESFIGNYRLAAVYSPETLSVRIAQALTAGMPWYILIAIAGVVLVALCTFTTYHPLHRLASKFKGSGQDTPDLFSRLDQAIEKQHLQNVNLRNRIEHYRTIMQKMLLDSMLMPDSENKNLAEDIDSYFMLAEHNFIAAFALNDPKASADSLFDNADHALTVMRTEDCVVFLVNRHFAQQASQEDALLQLANAIREKTGANIGVSDTSSTVMDIPSLTEQASSALSCADDEQGVVLWQQLGSINCDKEVNYQYPHDLLHAFSTQMSERQFDSAKETLKEIMELLSSVNGQNDAMPDFFIRSVLIDLLSDLAIQMDATKVKFREYEDLYFRALYLCRSCSYSETRDEIYDTFVGMMNVFDEQTGSVFPSAEDIEKMVSDNIANPDFSISNVYAGFDVSLAYMSHLFKKETGENFSEYLWKARYERACELLSQKQMNINEISLAVGYIHPSSFRRKFKQETGFSPTDYRPED